MPKARQDPAPGDLHGDLHFGFVAGFVGTGRDDGGAVMPGHIGVSPVDHRLVKARLGNTGLQIVADRLACRAIKIVEGANVRGDPIRKGLAPYCLGVEMLWGERRGQGIIVAGYNRRGAPCRSQMT
jgi:hypothetical protein